MPRSRVALLSVLAVLAIAAATIATAAAWLFYTDSGFTWITTRVIGVTGKGLTLDGVAGTLAHGARVQSIRYAGEDIEVRATDAYIRIAPWSLLTLTPRVTELSASELAVVTKPGEPRGRPPDTLELPLSFELPNAHVARLVIDLGKGPLDLTNVKLAYSGGATRHTVHALALHAFEHAITLRGEISARAPFELHGVATAKSADAPQTTAEIDAKGNLSALALEVRAESADARVSGIVRLEPYAELPLAGVNADIAQLDLNAFVKTLPRTAIAGTLALDRKGPVLLGPVALVNRAHGPYDQGRLPVAALELNVRDVSLAGSRFALTANLGPGGLLSGTGAVRESTAELTLDAKNLDLAALHTRMRKTRLAGRAQLSLTRERQSIDAALAQDDIKAAFVAQHMNGRIEVRQLRALARGGEAKGSGEMSLAGRKAFAVDLAFERFDPAAWGRFPAGSINGTLGAKGAVSGPAADVRLAIRDSRWLDAPLAAQGLLSIAGERLRHADVDATLGGNRIVAQGAFGAPRDSLALRIDAPKLGVLDARLQGAIRGTARVGGTWRAPNARFDLTAAELVYKGYGRARALEARGLVGSDAAGPLDVEASARGLETQGWQLDTARLRIEGTRLAHSAIVAARGERIDLRARARGGYRARGGWTGTLEELVNSGEAAVSLTAPVAVSVGPRRVHTGPFELRITGGRLHVSALTYDGGRLSTAGSFKDVPVRPFVVLAGGPSAAAGTLRLNGQWAIESTPRLTGSVSITHESGDLALGADRAFRPGLQALAVNATFGAQGAKIQADLRSAIATASAQGTVTADARTALGYGGASRIALTANVDVARLAPFATFIDTTMLLDGRVQAKLDVTGTLTNPQITGPVAGERIALALPAEGIELKDGTLKAVLTQRELRVDAFSIRGGEGVFFAQGTLARTGFDEASVDWRAERFQVLARPDRRLIVTGKGNAALRAGKLAFTGALRANEGLFELAATSLPTLGDDVVIVGPETRDRETLPPASGRKATRATVDMRIDLGNNVHLRGRGLDVWLSGELRVTTNAQGQLRAAGTVDARRGTFVAYGQRLEIERGRLFFNGPVTDPGLDIVALRKRQAVEAGVAVSGTMRRPLVRVVSNPPLPEGEALSWLVLGRAPDQAGAGQLAALPLATSALMGRASGAVARRLKLDDVGLRSGTAGSATAAQQFLTLGKRLTERLYLAFEQSLGGTENLLRLEYSLTQRIALRAQAGTTSSAGIFYRLFWD